MLSLTLSVAGCEKCSNNSSGNGAGELIGTAQQVGFNNQDAYQGLHDYTAPEVDTDDYIIKDGVFQYKLVFKDLNAQSASMINAREEFYTLTQKATGITSIPKVTDTSISSFSENDRYISFGDNALLEKAGVTYDKAELKTYGGRIITKGKSIFILGGSDAGVLNAVYTFMQICFNYEFFNRNCLQIDTGVKNLKLRKFDVTDVPDIDCIEISSNYYSATYNNATLVDQYALGDTVTQDLKMRKYRLRSIFTQNNTIHRIDGTDHTGATFGYIHNTTNYVEPGRVGIDVEEKWLAETRRQVCYTAHGDAESLQRMKEYCRDKIITALKATPYAKNQ